MRRGTGAGVHINLPVSTFPLEVGLQPGGEGKKVKDEAQSRLALGLCSLARE